MKLKGNDPGGIAPPTQERRPEGVRYTYLSENPGGCDDEYPAGIGYSHNPKSMLGPCMTDQEARELTLGANLLLDIMALPHGVGPAGILELVEAALVTYVRLRDRNFEPDEDQAQARR